MVQAEDWVAAVGWLYAAFLAVWLLRNWLNRHLGRLCMIIMRDPQRGANLYYYLQAPGTIWHELSHYLMAKILFVRTGNVRLFQFRPTAYRDERGRPTGRVVLGYVETYRTDPIRQSLIGVAPLLSGLAVLAFLAVQLGFGAGFSDAASVRYVGLTRQVALPYDYSALMNERLKELPDLILASLRTPLNWLLMYCVFTFGNNMFPSKPDRRGWLIGFFIPLSIVLLIVLTGHGPTLDNDSQRAWLQGFANLTWLFVFAAIINLVLALLTGLLEWALGGLFPTR